MATNKNRKPPEPKKLQVQSQWLKNVGRSLGVSATEMLGDIMPSSIEFATSSMETATDVYNDVRNNGMSGKRILTAFNLEDQYALTIEGFKNALEDIQSGKIYNKERIDKLYEDGEDFDLEDFDFDDDFGDTMDEDSELGSEPQVNMNMPTVVDNAPVVASINAQSEVIANAAEATISASRQQAVNSMMFSRKHTDLMTRSVGAINENLGMLVNFYDINMNNYIQASISYYESSLGHLSATVEELKKISFKEEEPEEKELVNKWDDILLTYGGLNIGAYGTMVKNNALAAMDEDIILSSIKSMITDKDTLRYMVASPLTFISTSIVKSLVPSMVQSSLQVFDETLSNFFPSLILKISSLGDKHEGNYLWEFVSKVFGVNNTNKNGIDVSKYTKGQVPFDGVAKKAITEVIPTYLKKILSAISGQEEMTFDYDKGTYKKTIDMQKEFTEEQARRSRSGYGDVISSIKTRSNAFQFEDPRVQESFQEGIDKFFSSLGKTGKFINPFTDSDEDFNDIYNFNGDRNLQRLFRAIMKSLERKDLMALSKGTIDSRNALTAYFDEIERKSDLSYETILSNGMEIDDTLDKDSKGKVIGFKANSPFNPRDGYNLSSLDYLRRIENILIQGIKTYPVTGSETGEGVPKLSYVSNQVDDVKRLEKIALEDFGTTKEITEKERVKASNKGIKVLGNSYDIGEEDEITNSINTYLEINKEYDDDTKLNQQDTAMKRFGKRLPENLQAPWASMVDTISSVISAPGRMIASAVDKLDKSLFNLIFGVSEDGHGYSFVDGMIAKFNSKLENVVTYFNEKIFDPLHEVLFGDEGWFTKFKQSDTFANMKVKLGQFADYAFGIKNMEGFREGGLFADTFNEMKDIFKGFGYYFTGRPYKDSKGNSHPTNSDSVFGNIKQITVDAYESTKRYVFGDDKDENGNSESDKPIGTIIKNSLITGATNFHKAIFGDDDTTLDDHKEIVTELADKVKDNLPKTLAWGALGAGAGVLAGTSSLGLMGSLFLPAGPIGGAVVAMGASLLSQSDAFMDKVFGHQDENGDRVGGMISASTQKFLKDNKNIIVGAGIIGALKPALGLGWLPSFILPGGPIGGALMGIATALAVRSNTFQELMFGSETGPDGKLTGGLLSSFSNKTKDIFGDMQAKNVLGNMGVGAAGGAALTLMVSKMGLLGSLLTPFGPMGGAMLGAAAGIALSSEKWRKAVFGEIDSETGKREGGALGKLGNWMEFNVLTPMKDTFDDVKVNVYKWFGESIAIPFREALFPIKTEIKYMIEQTNEMFAKGWGVIQNGISNTLGKFVIKPFGKFMEDHVMKPLRGFLGLAFKTSLKALQLSLSAPFKLMGVAGHVAERRQERRGKKTYINDLKKARKEGDIGRFEYVRQRYFDRDAMEDAKTAAKVGNAKQMREEAASQGMTFAQYVNSKKKAARDEYKGKLRDQFFDGEIGIKDYINSRFFDRRAMEMEEDKALGTNERNEYYARLDADKAKFREKVAEKERERSINKSRRKYLRQLGMDSGYSGFIYEKDKDGNTIENGSKVSVDRIVEALTMSKSNMTEDQQKIFTQIGKRLGVKNLLDMYTDSGLDMDAMSKKQKKKFREGITSGHANDLFRGLNPYTKEERQNAFNNELAELTKEYSDKVASKIDISNQALSEIENVFKDAYNLLRAKYGLRTIKFRKNTESKSATTSTPILRLPAPNDEIEEDTGIDVAEAIADVQESTMTPIITKMDYMIDRILDSNPEASSLLPMVINQEPQKEQNQKSDSKDDNKMAPNKDVTNAKLTAPSIIEANNKLLAKEKYIESEKKRKETIEANQKFTSRKTADFVINENNKKRGIKSFFENHLTQTNMLTAMNKSLSGLAKGLSWAFGKKGILTALFLTVLPMILKWLQDRNGDGPDHRIDGNGDTIDNSGVNKTINVALGKGLGKLAQEILTSPTAGKIAGVIGDKYGKWVGGLSEGVLKNFGNYTGRGAGVGADVILDIIAKNASGVADDTLKLIAPDDLIKIGSSSLDNVAKGSIDDIAKLTSQKLLGSGTTVIDWGKLGAKSVDDAAEGFAKYFNTFKYGKTSSQVNKELAEKLGSKGIIEATQYTVRDEAGRIVYEARETGAKKLLGWMKTALDDFTTIVLNGIKGIANVTIGSSALTSDIIKMVDQKLIMQKFGALVGNGSRLTLEVLSRTFTDGVMMTYGAVTGAFEAARLFRVYKQDVDITMSAISAAFKGAMNYKYMFLIEMLNEIIADVTDIDIFSMIATGIYKLISDNEKDFALEQAQLDFKEGVQMYNDKHGTKLTTDSYNDLVNKFLSEQIFDGGSAINHRITENALMTGNKIVKGGVKALIDGGTEGLSKYVSKGTKVASKVIDKLPFGKSLRSTAGAAKEFGKSAVKSVTQVLNEIDLGRMNTFRKLVSEALEKITHTFTKAFPKAGKKFGGTIRNAIISLSDDVLAKFLPKISNALAEKALGMTAGALTVGVWSAVEFVGGAIGGATKTGAANLFRVGQGDVDWIMRTIASIINGLLNVSWFFVIDILNDIYVAMTDTDFISHLASIMYEVAAGEENAVKLENDQIQFEQRVKEYNKENGTSLSVDEYNDEVENASMFTKVRNWWDDKKEEKTLRKEAKSHGMSVDEYKAFKKKRLKFEDEEVSDLSSIGAAMSSLEEQKEQIIASTDENMYNLRKIITATMEGLNVTTFEQLAPSLDLSESQLISVRKVIETTMYGLDDETREQMSQVLGVSGEALDGVYATMEGAMLGLNSTTLDKMMPIMDISEEKLEGVKWVVEQALGGMDHAAVKNMREMELITDEEMQAMLTIVDSTLVGMNEETLKNMAPILGITEENLAAVEALINETMRGINGETEDKLSDLDVADPLRKAKENIEEGMTLVEEESGNWFTNMVDTVSNWWNNSWIGEKFGQAGAWVGEKFNQGVEWVKDLGGKGGELVNQGVEWAKEKGQQGVEWAKGVGEKGKELVGQGVEWTKNKISEIDNRNRTNVAAHYGIDASEVNLGQRIMVGGAENIERLTKGLLNSEDIIKTVETVKTNVFDKFTEIKDSVSSGWQNFSEDVGIIAQGSAILVRRAWEDTKEKINEFVTPIVDFATETWSNIKETISTTWENTKSTISGLWDGFTTWTGETWESIKSNVSTTWDNTKSTISGIWDGFTAWTGETWETVKTNVSTTWDNTKSTISGIWDGFTTWTGETWETVKTNVSTTWENVKTSVGEKLGPVVEDAKQRFFDIKQNMIDKITSVKDNVKEHLGDPLIQGVKTAFTKIKDGIMAPINWVKEKFNGAKNAVKNGWNGIVNYFQGVIDSDGGYGEVDLGGKGGNNDDFISKQSTQSSIDLSLKEFEAKTQSNNVINNITNNYNGIPMEVMGGFGENTPKYGPGAKIIPVGGGKPQPVQGTNQSGIGEAAAGVEPDSIHDFAYYAQTDDRYKNHNYDLSPGLGHDSDPSLNARGCGPTSMAMIATQLTGKKYLPTTLADMSRKWGHSVAAGTSWAFFDKAADTFSMDMGKKSPSVSGMRSAISSGQPIIISGRRSKYAKSDSPFTTGGHFVVGVGTQGNSKILINDPRGSGYSKAYDIDKVANEARQIWQFKHNQGGSLPTPDGEYTASNTSNGNTSTVGVNSSSGEEELGTWGAFTKMLEAINIHVGNVVNGTDNRLSFDGSSGSSSSSSSSSGYASGFIPTTVQDAILKKTLELTVQNETGGSYTNVKNDVSVSSNGSKREISPSIGIIQMRGNNAKTIMQNMYKKLPNSTEAKYWAEWDWSNDAPWNATQRQRLSNYLSSNLSVAKEVQDAHALEYIKNNNLSQVYKHGVDTGKISDPRSIVHLAEIGNTGPAWIGRFLSNYNKNKGGDEFPHYFSEFKSKSFWGPKSIYQNRINKTYNELRNWDAKQMIDGGKGGDNVAMIYDSLFGGFGENAVNKMIENVVKNAEEQATQTTNALMPCELTDSCGMPDLGGKGPELFADRRNDQVTADRANKMVDDLMKSVKSRDLGEPTVNATIPENPNDIRIAESSQRMIDSASEGISAPDAPEMAFNPDLSVFNDLGGKGGEPEAEEAVESKESSVSPTMVEGEDKTAKEIKSLNDNVTNMTNKITAKTPTLISDDKVNRTAIIQTQASNPSMSEALMLEIISILKGVEDNTGNTSAGINSLADKELSLEVNNDITIEKDSNGNPIAIVNGGTTNVNPMFKTSTNTNTDVKYSTAKSIARGRINK